MLTKSMMQMRNRHLTFTSLAHRCIGSKTYQSGDNFNFPKHKEFFNDMYYEQEEDASKKGAFGKEAPGPFTQGDDYIDPNEPFIQETPFVPGGILATYKKKLDLSAEEVMEENYWENVKTLKDQATDYFTVVNKNEKDLMAQTKNFT